MKVLICGNERETAKLVQEAIYDAGCRPIGPAESPLAALGLADQEHPALAVLDVSAIEDNQGNWLAEKLSERGVALICISETRAIDAALARQEHTFVAKPTGRQALAQCVIARRRRHELAQRGTPPVWRATPASDYRPAL